MSKADHSDLPDLVKTATPLPWTTGGPNDHPKPPQTASNPLIVSVVDPVYYYKNRVIDMKQLEAIKKRLPRGIDVRINSKKVLSFRVRFRKKGYPDQIKTFPDEKLAKQWLAEQERNALLGIHFPQVRASENTLAEAIDRYIAEELRYIWKNESSSFTPWLAQEDNLALLPETLRMNLQLEGTELSVAAFRADIVCKDLLRHQIPS